MSTVLTYELTQTSDRKVICLSATGDKDDFVLTRPEQRCYFPASPINRSSSLLAISVNAGGIAKRFDKATRQHRRDSLVDWRRGAVVQINLAFGHQKLVF